MVIAYHQIREVMFRKPKVEDLRSAAFINALGKVASDYMNMGIFP
jgi:glutamate dehydrogenase (NAD(P)+)